MEENALVGKMVIWYPWGKDETRKAMGIVVSVKFYQKEVRIADFKGQLFTVSKDKIESVFSPSNDLVRKLGELFEDETEKKEKIYTVV